jgi:hypothetical protein
VRISGQVLQRGAMFPVKKFANGLLKVPQRTRHQKEQGAKKIFVKLKVGSFVYDAEHDLVHARPETWRDEVLGDRVTWGMEHDESSYPETLRTPSPQLEKQEEGKRATLRASPERSSLPFFGERDELAD